MNKAEQKRELWRQRIAQQESSGQSIRAYCRARGLHEHAFYGWRQRLRKQTAPVKFALVETKPAEAETAPPIELMLASGDFGFRTMPRRSSWCWRCCGIRHDPPAGQRSRVLVHLAVRHAEEL